MSATTDLDGVGAETGPRIRSAGKRSGASRRAWLRLTLMGILPLAAVLGGGYWYLTTGRFMSTDDAYVQADAVSISSDVAGRVVEVDVHNNEKVKQGQLLFKLDDRPYKIAVERAEAQLAAEKLQIDGLRATYRQKQADLKQAQDTLGYQQREADRQQQLLNDHIVSQSHAKPWRRHSRPMPMCWQPWAGIPMSTPISIRSSNRRRPHSTRRS
jgi:membrane fusion protein (multidrug efflux system)